MAEDCFEWTGARGEDDQQKLDGENGGVYSCLFFVIDTEVVVGVYYGRTSDRIAEVRRRLITC